MYRSIVVPMNVSGDDLTMHCCQIASAYIFIIVEMQPDACMGFVLYYGNNGCCQKKWYNLILHFRSHQFIGHNPLGLMRAAIVSQDHFSGTVTVIHGTRILTAAAPLFVRGAGDSGDNLFCSAVLA